LSPYVRASRSFQSIRVKCRVSRIAIPVAESLADDALNLVSLLKNGAAAETVLGAATETVFGVRNLAAEAGNLGTQAGTLGTQFKTLGTQFGALGSRELRWNCRHQQKDFGQAMAQ
jgi:hypothetical protein